MSTAPQPQPQHHQVRIHIDQHPHHSPNPTTGEALYVLGGVAAGFELFREVRGNREDKLIESDADVIRLHEDDHFHSGPAQVHQLAIIVNGQQKHVKAKSLTFEQLVALAFNPVPTGPNILFTITYECGPRQNPEGTLMPGGTVKIKEGMIFNVTATDKS
jgi:Multiubiquitin